MKIETKNCIFCPNSFTKAPKDGRKEWDQRKYCSRQCSNLNTRTPEIKKKISETCKERGIGTWMEGRKRPIETILKQREKMMKLVSNGTHNFWKGGSSKITRSERRNFQGTFKYKQWRRDVFERDNYTCQGCEKRGGYLEVDHIKSYAMFPELRTSLENGRTLCRPCHLKTPNFGSKAFSIK